MNCRLYLPSVIELALFCSLISIELCPTNGDVCRKSSSCACLGNNYEINLSHLASKSKLPRFNQVTSTVIPGVSFAYNPCYGFREGDDTNPGSCGQPGTAVCMTNGTQHLALGTQDSAQFVFNATMNATEIRYYSVFELQHFMYTFLSLKCEPTLHQDQSRLTVDNVIENNLNETVFYMSLISSCACPNSCLHDEDNDFNDDQSLSFGSVLVILFCFGVLLYLCGGIVFLHFMRGATGWEVVPHYDFWMDLPLLIRDGVQFAVNGCKPAANYDRI